MRKCIFILSGNWEKSERHALDFGEEGPSTIKIRSSIVHEIVMASCGASDANWDVQCQWSPMEVWGDRALAALLCWGIVFKIGSFGFGVRSSWGEFFFLYIFYIWSSTRSVFCICFLIDEFSLFLFGFLCSISVVNLISLKNERIDQVFLFNENEQLVYNVIRARASFGKLNR